MRCSERPIRLIAGTIALSPTRSFVGATVAQVALRRLHDRQLEDLRLRGA